MSENICCIWADEVVSDLDVTSRAILRHLASVADDDARAWMTVAKLVERVGASERTIQSRLRALEGVGGGRVFLRRTGEVYRLGTRSVPYYELMVDYPAVAEVIARRERGRRSRAEVLAKGFVRPRSMGATVCTHAEPMGADVRTPMGATACTRKREPKESQEGSLSLTKRGRALEESAERIVAGYPEAYRAVTSVREVLTALRSEASEGRATDDVEAACLAYAANRKAWGPSGWPMAAHKLIASGRWESHAPAQKASEPTRTGFAEEPWRIALVDVMGEAWVRSWVDPCAWDAASSTLDPRLRGRAERLREPGPSAVLARFGVQVGKVG